ncbi:hypothetical protein EON80_27930 [bacterium]|nr:MAG: hypothetical protein EON80_27930 [bacterium]
MKRHSLIIGTTATLLLAFAHIPAQAIPDSKGQINDFTIGPRIFLQKNSDASNKNDISQDGPKALSLKNPKDKDEIKKKRMVIVGPEGEYLIGFHVYWEKTPDPFPLQSESVYFKASYPGGSIGGDIMMPDKKPVGILNSPWIKISDDVKRTSTRSQFKLKKGTNIITFEIDATNKWNEVQMNTYPPSPKKSLEGNNTMTFAVEVVTEIEKPDIKLPPQKRPKL